MLTCRVAGPSASSRLVAAALVALAPGAGGCSLALVRGAPAGRIEPAANVHCTRSPALPIVDAAFAAGLAVGGMAALNEHGCTGQECYSGYPSELFGGVLLFAAAAEVASAYLGLLSARACRDVLDGQEACRGGDDAACARLVSRP